MSQRPETMEALQEVFAILKCVKCSNIPKDKVWSLVTCEHKYCSECFDLLNQGELKTCIVCANFEYAEDLTNHDNVSTLLLEKLRALEVELNKSTVVVADSEIRESKEDIHFEALQEEDKLSVYYDTSSHVSPKDQKENCNGIELEDEIEDMFFSGGSDTEADGIGKKGSFKKHGVMRKQISVEKEMATGNSVEKSKPTSNGTSGRKLREKDMDTDSIPIHSGSESEIEDELLLLKVSKSTRKSDSSSDGSVSLLHTQNRKSSAKSVFMLDEDSPLLVVPAPKKAPTETMSPVKPGSTHSGRRTSVSPVKSKAIEKSSEKRILDLGKPSDSGKSDCMLDEDSELVIVPAPKSVPVPVKSKLLLPVLKAKAIESSSEDELFDLPLSPDPVIQTNSRSIVRSGRLTSATSVEFKSKEFEISSSEEDVVSIPVSQNKPKSRGSGPLSRRPSATIVNTKKIESSSSEDEADVRISKSKVSRPKSSLGIRSSARLKTPEKVQAQNNSKPLSGTKSKKSQIKTIDIESESIEDMDTEDPTAEKPPRYSPPPPVLTQYGNSTKSPGAESDTSSGFGLVFGNSLTVNVSPLAFVRGKQGIPAAAKPMEPTKVSLPKTRSTRGRVVVSSDTEDESVDSSSQKSVNGSATKKAPESPGSSPPTLTQYEKASVRKSGDDSGFGQPPVLTQYENLSKSPNDGSDTSCGLVFGNKPARKMSPLAVRGKQGIRGATNFKTKEEVKTRSSRGKLVDSSDTDDEPVEVETKIQKSVNGSPKNKKKDNAKSSARKSNITDKALIGPGGSFDLRSERSPSPLFSASDIGPPVSVKTKGRKETASRLKKALVKPIEPTSSDSEDEPIQAIKEKVANQKNPLKPKPLHNVTKANCKSPAKSTPEEIKAEPPTPNPEVKSSKTEKFSIFKSKNTRNSAETDNKAKVNIEKPKKKTAKQTASAKKSQASKFKQTVYKPSKSAEKELPEEKPGPSSRISKPEPSVQVPESPRTLALRRRGTRETNGVGASAPMKTTKSETPEKQNGVSSRVPLKRPRAPETNTSARPKRLRTFSETSSSTSEISKSSAAVVTPKLRERTARAQTTTPDSRTSSRRSSQFSSPGSTASSIDKRNPKGETALHLAAKTGNVEKVKQLIAFGADLNARDFADWTPLHEAINGKRGNNLAIAKLLCDARCHVNAMGLGQETPLHEAARLGNAEIITLLLSHSASSNIRNKFGQLPREVAKTKEIAKLMDNFKGPIVRQALEDDDTRFNNNLLERCLIFFAYDVEDEILEDLTEEFKARITTQLSGDVTHIIFDVDSKKAPTVPLTLNYLFGVLSGAWMLSSHWIRDSLLGKKLLDPEPYEIAGCETESRLSSRNGVPKLSRLNKELGQPGLLHGMCFYIYKNSSYKKLSKKELGRCIQAGDGTILIREPNPDQVDPLEHPVRFHAQDPQHKLVLTSHLILFSAGNEPSKKHSMEHVKTLSLDWLIQSILNFKLADPDNFRRV